MFLPFLVAGLILAAGGSWFTGAVTVGTILLAICAVILVVQVIGLLLAGRALRNFDRRF